MEEKANNINENQIEVWRVFIDEYNLRNGTKYRFECFRPSMFNFPKYKEIFEYNWHKDLIVWEAAFMEGEKQNPLIADVKVLFRFQKRLIIEAVELPLSHMPMMESMIRLVDFMEYSATKEVVCSQYLLVDLTDFLNIRTINPDAYKDWRLGRDKILKQSNKNELQELESRGIPLKHWFKEIWILYYNEKGSLKCRQIW